MLLYRDDVLPKDVGLTPRRSEEEDDVSGLIRPLDDFGVNSHSYAQCTVIYQYDEVCKREVTGIARQMANIDRNDGQQ
jgi:hypothetical protein